MKANRKFKEDEEAVSAVIGVILMVAITVAIAATVYVYVSGMIGTSPQSTPEIQFTKDELNDKLIVATADPADLKWGHFEWSYSGTTATTDNVYSTGWGTDTQQVKAGDELFWLVTTSGLVVKIIHTQTNTLIGTYTFIG